MRWHCILLKLSLLVVLALLLASPVMARGNATPGIYPGTLKDVCMGDTIFVEETGLNLTPLTPWASGTVIALYKFPQDNPALPNPNRKIDVANSRSFNVESDKVKEYGTYFPVSQDGTVLRASGIQIQSFIARYPTDVVITTSREWLSANGAETATITITVKDGKGSPVTGANLALSASSPWALGDAVLVTDGSGKAQTSFLPTKKSGSAVITVSASVDGVTPPAAPVTTTLIQKIDAGTPARATAFFPSIATVGSPAAISVLVEDQFGNPVNSYRYPKAVALHSLSGGTGAFLDSEGDRVKAVNATLNGTGYADATFLLNTLEGDNLILVLPPSPLSFQIIDIVGIGNAMPASIVQVTDPAGDPPFIPADGITQAKIDYFLFDKWGNPSIDQPINVTTDAGEKKIFITNQEGRVTVYYGPKLKAAFYTLTATAMANPEVRKSQTLQFGSLDPADMLLTASPQTMASLDVNAKMKASVIGKVIDIKGNPVKGQTVTFRIEKDSSPFALNESARAAIGAPGIGPTSEEGDPISLVTDGNGQAILDYTPGAFPVWGEAGWSDTATGTTILSATWDAPDGKSVVRQIELSYKNYPFISVYTEVSPKTVQIGNKVNVSIRLVGDGWALQPKPIDVVLCTDRSGTMLMNESIVNKKLVSDSKNDRMVDAMNAAKVFVDKTTDVDRIGILTFADPNLINLALLYNTSDPLTWKYIDTLYATRAGKDYTCEEGNPCKDPNDLDVSNKTAFILSTYKGHGTTGKNYQPNYGVRNGTYVEAPLGSTKAQLHDAIDSIVPAGGTPTRRALYESVKMVIKADPPKPGVVRAVILLTDGKWNVGGDPRGIIPDTVFIKKDSFPELAADPLINDGKGSVITWAKNNKVKIFTIALMGSDTSDLPNEAELIAYANETGGKYHRADNSSQLEGIYKEIAGELREEASINTRLSLDFKKMEVNGVPDIPGKDVFQYKYIPGQSTWMTAPNGTGYDIDNTADWEKGNFSFSQGTIKVDEQWMVNFTLNSTMEGNIKVLSAKTSRVTFEGVEGNVSIPDTYITAIPVGIEMGPEDIVFKITKLERQGDEDNQVAMLAWNYIYTGGDQKIQWEIWIAPLNSNAFQFRGNFPSNSVKDLETQVLYNLVIRDLKPGSYTVKVRGRVRDANDAEKTLHLTVPGSGQKTQILIR